jgi:NTE family protein
MSSAGMKWPTSDEYLGSIYPKFRRRVTAGDLLSLKSIGWAGLGEFNLRLVRSRASVLATMLERVWGVAGRLADMPDSPQWLINTTCIDTGKNWRFSKQEMATGLLAAITRPTCRWRSPSPRRQPCRTRSARCRCRCPPRAGGRRIPPPASRRARKRRQKRGCGSGTEAPTTTWVSRRCRSPGAACDFLICSDASGPLRPPGGSPFAALIRGSLSSPRLFDVAGDQIRALRSRMLIADIAAGTVEGVLLRMGNSVRAVDVKSGMTRPATFYDGFQSDEQAELALRHPTDLKAPSEAQFDMLARHGFEIADATLTTYVPARFSQSSSWGDCT